MNGYGGEPTPALQCKYKSQQCSRRALVTKGFAQGTAWCPTSMGWGGIGAQGLCTGDTPLMHFQPGHLRKSCATFRRENPLEVQPQQCKFIHPNEAVAVPAAPGWQEQGAASLSEGSDTSRAFVIYFLHTSLRVNIADRAGPCLPCCPWGLQACHPPVWISSCPPAAFIKI